MSRLTGFEKETVINFNEADDNMIIYTASKRVFNHLNKIFEPCKVYRNDGKITGWEFVIPKNTIRIKPNKGRALVIAGR